MRIDPRSSLSVQLIHEANFGPERFEPFGPPLSREVEGPWSIHTAAGDQVELSDSVARKPQPCPADVYTCDARLGPVLGYRLGQEQAEVHVHTEVREVAVPTTLPTHVVGSLLDVLA
ncbi:hypothetical protein [Algisphaera agarilytica]|uniref:Uncharacterized protein n=1 Tax=Algisphaera agarilytica TaxID=1385975 RepID=A0A7X0HCA1_9BACT|nr:hypothetical protein [Algisphaera agarilytica]MBB6431725.1 hypothetical protein [Algisphaera agarilytica]